MVGIGCVINSAGLAEFILRRDLFSQFSDHRMVAWDLRINGIAPNAIVFAFTSVWLLPWALWLHLESRTRLARTLALVAFAYLAMLSVLTFNRQTPLIIAAMLGVGLLLVRTPWRGVLIVVCGGLALAAAPFIVGRITERLAQLGNEGAPDISLMIRRDKVLVAREMIRAHPWTGIGLNNFKDHWWEHRPTGELYQIHTDMARPQYIDLGWLQIVTETGFIGLALLLATLTAAAMAWWTAWRRARERWVQNALVAVLMLFIQLGVSMMVQDTFFTAWTYLSFAMLAVMVRFAREETHGPHTEADAHGAPHAI
jgi:O-antigen ligase